MSRPVRYHPLALEEQAEAAEWYDEKAELGEDLLARLQATRAAVARHPESFPLVQGHSDVRGARLERFPYRLIYAVSEDEILLLAVAHDKRRPDYWLDRHGEEA